MARAGGAGAEETAHRLGAQAVWLSLAFGVGVAVLVAVLAEPLVSLMGGEGQTADYAVTYLRIAAIGLPAAFLALGGQGYLRGISDLRTPLVVLVVANAVNLVLEVVFVYGLDWGIEGSAWGTALAQLGMGAAFLVLIARGLNRTELVLRLALARRVLLTREVDLHQDDRPHGLLRPGGRGRDPVRGRLDRRPPGRIPALGLPRTRARCDSDHRSGSSSGASSVQGTGTTPTRRARG